MGGSPHGPPPSSSSRIRRLRLLQGKQASERHTQLRTAGSSKPWAIICLTPHPRGERRENGPGHGVREAACQILWVGPYESRYNRQVNLPSRAGRSAAVACVVGVHHHPKFVSAPIAAASGPGYIGSRCVPCFWGRKALCGVVGGGGDDADADDDNAALFWAILSWLGEEGGWPLTPVRVADSGDGFAQKCHLENKCDRSWSVAATNGGALNLSQPVEDGSCGRSVLGVPTCIMTESVPSS